MESSQEMSSSTGQDQPLMRLAMSMKLTRKLAKVIGRKVKNTSIRFLTKLMSMETVKLAERSLMPPSKKVHKKERLRSS